MSDSFTIYRNTLDALETLPPETSIKIVSYVGRYAMDNVLPQADDAVAMAFFTQIRPLIDKNKHRAENGKKGGRPRTKDITDEEQLEEKKARHSTEYKKWRDAVYERDGYVCQECGSTENLHAHHIQSFTDAPELRFDVDNGITLCAKCHSKAHSYKPSEKLNKANEELDKAKKPINKKVESRNIKKENIYTLSSGAAEYQYKAVIDYLNEKAGTAFKDKSKDSRSHIKARFDDGFTLDDFKTVIDKKVAEWGGTDMAKFLRPSTLFGTKFESYLNQQAGTKNTTNRFNNFEGRCYDYDDMERQLLAAQYGST